MAAEVFTLVFSQATLLVILGFVGRSIYLHWLGKDLERFKDQLRFQQETHLRQSQHSLDLLKLEHQVRFSALYEKRFLKVEELHKDGRDLTEALLESLKTERATRLDRIAAASQKTFALHQKLKLFELFLPAAFFEEWDRELSEISLSLSFLANATADPTNPDMTMLKQSVDKIAASLRKMNGQLVAKAREILET
jgi:hypothetical protein